MAVVGDTRDIGVQVIILVIGATAILIGAGAAVIGAVAGAAVGEAAGVVVGEVAGMAAVAGTGASRIDQLPENL